MYYFNINLDIRIIILSKLSLDDIDKLSNISPNINMLTHDPNFYLYLIKLNDTHIYSILRNYNNMLDGYTGKKSYKNIYYYLHDIKNYKIERSKYIYNLVYLSKILKEFTNIFELIKDINLLHTYLFKYKPEYNDWYLFYTVLKKYKKLFINVVNNYSEIYYTINDKIYLDNDKIYIHRIVSYSHNINSLNKNPYLEKVSQANPIFAEILIDIYVWNTDAYKNILSKLSKSQLNEINKNLPLFYKKYGINIIDDIIEDLYYRL